MFPQNAIKNYVELRFCGDPGRLQTRSLKLLHPCRLEHDTLVGFQQEAAKFNSIISLPDFETTTNAIELSVKETIADANAALDQIGRLQPPTSISTIPSALSTT